MEKLLYELLTDVLPEAFIWLIAWGLVAGAVISIARVLKPVVRRLWHLIRLIEFIDNDEPLFDQIKSIRADVKETQQKVDHHLIYDHNKDQV